MLYNETTITGQQTANHLYEMPLEETKDPREVKITRGQIMAENSTLTFLLCGAYYQVTGRRLRIEHSLGDGVYCIDGEYKEMTQEIVDKVEQQLREMVNNDTPIELPSTARSELIRYFSGAKFSDKVSLLGSWHDHYIPCIKFGDHVDYVLEPLTTDKSRLKLFRFHLYSPGFVLLYPTLLNPNYVNEWIDCTIQHEMFVEAEHWTRLLETETVAHLNRAIFQKTISELIPVAEGLHERKIASIAEILEKNFEKNGKRIVVIAGPSASGKTTFSRRLQIQLAVSGFEALNIRLDNYMKDKNDIPQDEEGRRDYYGVDALNIGMFADHVNRLLKGEKVQSRNYDYFNAKGLEGDETLYLGPHDFLIVEGLHGLNEKILDSLGKDKLTTIYVQALTPLNVDFNHRFPTSDLRLIRRILRDSTFREIPVRETIKRWTNARVNETRNVFPYMKNADLFFNTALMYELPVLYIKAKVLLSEAAFPMTEKQTKEEEEITAEARRLLGLIGLFYPMSPEKVPRNSVIREFIGGSELDVN